MFNSLVLLRILDKFAFIYTMLGVFFFSLLFTRLPIYLVCSFLYRSLFYSIEKFVTIFIIIPFEVVFSFCLLLKSLFSIFVCKSDSCKCIICHAWDSCLCLLNTRLPPINFQNPFPLSLGLLPQHRSFSSRTPCILIFLPYFCSLLPVLCISVLIFF